MELCERSSDLKKKKKYMRREIIFQEIYFIIFYKREFRIRPTQEKVIFMIIYAHIENSSKYDNLILRLCLAYARLAINLFCLFIYFLYIIYINLFCKC